MNRVLMVVDDNQVSRILPGLILRAFSTQIQVLECASGGDALRMLESVVVSHVLLDISMPAFDGIEVAKAIAESFPAQGLRLLAYTADVRAMDDAVLKSAGFDAVLLKPLQRDDLLRALDLPG